MTGRWTLSLEERFWSKVQKTGGCWLWVGHKDSRGYGRFSLNGMRLAHRVAWELTREAIPDGKVACHRCDNPSCVRPDHIFIGTQADNLRDMAQKGRHFSVTKPHRVPRGERQRAAKLTEADVVAIRSQRASGTSTKDLARRYGVSRSLVVQVISRTAWKHIG